ncbi:MAG: hypothetical protein EA381_13730 [Planctomycetaceae bacterium]|nr:MAG: hypothetical protein EA381_13730 [Planctomycetaceae bacterium]
MIGKTGAIASETDGPAKSVSGAPRALIASPRATVALLVGMACLNLGWPFQGVALAQSYPSVTGSSQSPVDIPRTNLTPVQQPFSPPSMTGTTSLFDPYSTGPGAGAYAPAVPGVQPVPGQSTLPNWNSGTSYPPPNYSPQVAPPPSFGLGNPGFGTQSFGQPGFDQSFGQPMGQTGFGQTYGVPGLPPPNTFPPSAFPSGTPSSLYPGGFAGGSTWSGVTPAPLRLMSGHRFDASWIPRGDSVTSLGMTDFDAAVHFSFPDFFRSGTPLVISPGYGMTFFDGPSSTSGADLPGQVYSAYLDADWQSDPNQIFSIDLGLQVGMFSDFDTNIGDSFRILGRGLGLFRLTPQTTFKGGVYYLDRNRVKLLPAFGVTCMPTPMSRLDLFFPEPKWSRYLSTLGTHDVWGYVAGEYGGGSWTVQREAGGSERVDVNDLRVLAGFEWGRSDQIRNGHRTGFFEVGYVFDREIIYRNNSGDNINPGDAVMLRVGINY